MHSLGEQYPLYRRFINMRATQRRSYFLKLLEDARIAIDIDQKLASEAASPDMFSSLASRNADLEYKVNLKENEKFLEKVTDLELEFLLRGSLRKYIMRLKRDLNRPSKKKMAGL